MFCRMLTKTFNFSLNFPYQDATKFNATVFFSVVTRKNFTDMGKHT